MPELLLELFSEEIPARMQRRAASDLQRLVTDGLRTAGLDVGDSDAYVTPRRLTLHIHDLPAMSPAVTTERKGPRVGAPDKAIAGFLKGSGLASIADAEIITDPKKGDFYVARKHETGRDTHEIIAELILDVIAKFPWPKSMRWGDGTLTWVRPLQSILCLLGGTIVPFKVGDLTSGDTTQGHRFLAPGTLTITSFADYKSQLETHNVILDSRARAELIQTQALAIAAKHNLALVADDALLVENAGLNEWPTVLLGGFDEAFLDVPAEALTTSMKSHQKCFSLTQPGTQPGSNNLSNHFLLVSNLEAQDGGTSIIKGNEKVIAARLSDAKFFWDQDLKRSLPVMAHELANITFHEKLGSQAERVERITELARQIAGAVDAEPELAGRAAQLCKADLVSGMVGEFPELQGVMGRYYANAGGENAKIARAIELHYKPKGPSDTVPLAKDGDAVAIAVALADKLDMLVGFWAINAKPTGSGDPYQLRRAALGVIRIVLDNDLRLSLAEVFSHADNNYRETCPELVERHWSGKVKTDTQNFFDNTDLLSFFADRLKVYLRDKGARHDLIDAVFALGGQDDLALIVKRVAALGDFLESEDGTTLLAGVKRASNILTIEEKKDNTSFGDDYDKELLTEPQELALAAAIESVRHDTKAAINVENFTGAMNALAELRAPVDAFFDKVTVNVAGGDKESRQRNNRLALLSAIRNTAHSVADFSKIAG